MDSFTTWYTLPDGSMDSGYYIGRNPTWAVQGEVINYLYQPQQVYLDVEFEYLDGSCASDPVDDHFDGYRLVIAMPATGVGEG